MVKTTKRARKFIAKGGIKGALEKGTISKKGKMRNTDKMRKKGRLDPAALAIMEATERRKNEQAREENEKKRREEDFTSDSNLGDLDMDTFLNSVEDEADGDSGDDINEEDDAVMEDDISDDDSDDDDDNEDMEDDSDDEDIEAAEARMKAEMSKLAESDPDFHAYLEKNEDSLLDFKAEIIGVGDDDEDDEDSDDDDDDAQMKQKKGSKKRKSDEDSEDEEEEEAPKIKSNEVLVDAKTLKTLEYGAFESHGLKPLRKLVQAYVSACHMADAADQDEDKHGRMRDTTDTNVSNGGGSSKRYLIESSTVFDKLMVTCLTKFHEEFHYHLLGKGSGATDAGADADADADGGKGGDKGEDSDEDEDKDTNKDTSASTDYAKTDKPINPRKLTTAKRWPALNLSMQSFIKATLHLMDQAKEPQLLCFIIKSLSNYLPYLSAFPRLGKALLKSLSSQWASTSDASLQYQTVRVNAFLRIRQLALTQPFPFIEQCLKSVYLAYAKSAKFAKAASISSLLPQLTFMGNCVVELYSLDYASSYQHAFIYIRQLALHLRSALQKKTPEAFRIVYCWQYMHCLKLWTAVLSASASTSKPGENNDESALMRSLIYPLVEIIFGVAKLIPSARHLPLRLHCVRYLQQLAAASETFIPTTSLLLEVFDLREITLAPKRIKKKNSDVKGVRLPVILKLPKVDTLRTVEQLDACLGETFLLLNREVDLYKFSAGIPEFSVRICQRLRKYAKATKNGKSRAYARGSIELCEKASKSAILARSKLIEAPKDIRRIEVLKPNNAPSMGERYDMAIAKERRLEVASQPEVGKAAKEKAKIMKQQAMEDAQAQAQAKKDKDSTSTSNRKSKGKINSLRLDEEALQNVEALEEEDEVQEGIDWSESEEDSDEDAE